MSEKYIACADMNLEWDSADVDFVAMMYRKDFSILEMSAVLQRPCDEISILITDLFRKQKISLREMGIYGYKEMEQEIDT